MYDNKTKNIETIILLEIFQFFRNYLAKIFNENQQKTLSGKVLNLKIGTGCPVKKLITDRTKSTS